MVVCCMIYGAYVMNSTVSSGSHISYVYVATYIYDTRAKLKCAYGLSDILQNRRDEKTHTNEFISVIKIRRTKYTYYTHDVPRVAAPCCASSFLYESLDNLVGRRNSNRCRIERFRLTRLFGVFRSLPECRCSNKDAARGLCGRFLLFTRCFNGLPIFVFCRHVLPSGSYPVLCECVRSGFIIGNLKIMNGNSVRQ